MKRLLFVVSMVLFLFSCSSNAIKGKNMSSEGTDDQTRSSSSELLFYIDSCSAGGSFGASVPRAAMKALILYEGTFALDEVPGNACDIDIDLLFKRWEDDEGIRFSIEVKNLLFEEKDGIILLNTSSDRAACIWGTEQLDFEDVSVQGTVSPKDSARLVVSGLVNGCGFSLDISSAVANRDLVIPSYTGMSEIDWMNCRYYSFSNDTGQDLSMTIYLAGYDKEYDPEVKFCIPLGGVAHYKHLFVEGDVNPVQVQGVAIFLENGEEYTSWDLDSCPFLNLTNSQFTWQLVVDSFTGFEKFPFERIDYSIVLP